MKAVENDMPAEIVVKRRDSSVVNWMVFLLAISPAVYLTWLISATAVNILYADEWGYIFLFHDLANHSLTLHDLLRQHNESRTTLPNLIVLGLGALTHWDVRWDMWLSFLFACVISANVYLFGRRSMNRRQGLILWAIANLLIFSTAQSQNWTWGIQMIVFMPIMFLTLGMLVAYSRMNVTRKFIACMVLATASTYSYANGQLAWVLLLAALVIGSRDQTRKLGWQIGMWLAAFAANMWVYYRDYKAPPRSPSMLFGLKHPIDALEYFAGFLGAPLGQGFHRLWISVAFGAVLIGCLASACHYLWGRREQMWLRQSAGIWLLISGYTVASAIVTTAGRVGYGVNYSQDSRYTSFSLYLVVGLIFLGAIIVKDLHRRGFTLSAKVFAALGLTLVLVPHIFTEVGGTHQMWADRRVRVAGKGFTQLLDLFPYPQGIYMHSYALIEKDFLNQRGYLSPGLIKSRDLTKIAASNGREDAGYMDTMNPTDQNTWIATGWGIIPSRHDPAEIVLLAGEDGTGSAIAFGESLANAIRPDVARATHNPNYDQSGWWITFKSADVPPGTKIISAWVYDAETGKAYRLGEPRPFAK